MDPTKIRNWLLLIAAAAAVLLPYHNWQMVKAQEAGRKAAVEQQAPMANELSEIKELLRRQEDREAFKLCLDAKYQDLSSDARYQACERESNLRWAYWECTDRTPKNEWLAKCGAPPK